MNVFTHNYNPESDSGPNKFSRQLFKQLMSNEQIKLVNEQRVADIEFCLIQQGTHKVKPMVLRLDGIWFNTEQDYTRQNRPLRFAYQNANAIIFQSNFNKELTEHWFGQHNNAHVIHNAPDLNLINSELIDETYKKIKWPWDDDIEVWSCASAWRPHKRLNENILCFLEKAPKKAVLAIAGKDAKKVGIDFSNNDRIFFLGDLPYHILLCLYKRSTTFIHLAYLDHCPNVVVDAQASGCKVICSSSGGTKEIINHGIIIKETPWDYSPIKLYEPPKLDLENSVIINETKKDKPNIEKCAQDYYNVMKGLI
jgi:glycosyltransferase involved in cell wall biosynthesis